MKLDDILLEYMSLDALISRTNSGEHIRFKRVEVGINEVTPDTLEFPAVIYTERGVAGTKLRRLFDQPHFRNRDDYFIVIDHHQMWIHDSGLDLASLHDDNMKLSKIARKMHAKQHEAKKARIYGAKYDIGKKLHIPARSEIAVVIPRRDARLFQDGLHASPSHISPLRFLAIYPVVFVYKVKAEEVKHIKVSTKVSPKDVGYEEILAKAKESPEFKALKHLKYASTPAMEHNGTMMFKRPSKDIYKIFNDGKLKRQYYGSRPGTLSGRVFHREPVDPNDPLKMYLNVLQILAKYDNMEAKK